MASMIKRFVFSEPAGRLSAAMLFSGSFVFLSVYMYYGILRDVSSGESLVIATGFALSGFAESLPSERRRAAGGLRLTASLLLLGLIGLLVFAPEVVIGPR
ncbi:hypothetical protein [Halohasta salina]|uniref:hypothetical protein n=1 Tax=Halohasta salina TaxID=2961621 RepID=UPI0020A30937|nr:hypothetical protein [Halohasta salina]